MIRPRTAPFLLLLALSACGSKETPEAPPGSVERTTESLARNEAAERVETIRRIDRDAQARAEDSKRRIKAVEQGQPEQE